MFTTPETIDRKAQSKNVINDKEKKKETTMVQQTLATSATRNRADAHKRNGMIGSRDQRMMRMKGVFHGVVPSIVDEEASMFNVHKMSSTRNFLKGELYSRVVAPPTSRSSSSSSSSESTASFESSKAVHFSERHIFCLTIHGFC